jgi:hypothetical protein
MFGDNTIIIWEDILKSTAEIKRLNKITKRSRGLWQWYVNITIIGVNIIHPSVFYLKLDILETEFCLCPQGEPTVDPLENSSFFYWVNLSKFHLRQNSFSKMMHFK